MGFNTVAVLYNDHTDRFRHSGSLIGPQIADAMVRWMTRDRDPLATHFGGGMVISQAHADFAQVVIVGRNSGVRADDADDLDWVALDQMQRCLERHGYQVRKLRKRKPVAEPLPTPVEREGA